MKIYLIGGKARHGKDTTGGMIKNYYEKIGKKACIMHIGNYIKHFAIDYFGWDGKEETKPRALLQNLGTEVIRKEMNKPLFFINRLVEDMEVLSRFFDVIVVTDVRLPIEFDKICEKYPDSIKIMIERINFETSLTIEQQQHVTETALDNYNEYKYKLINNTLNDLKKEVINIIEKEKTNEETN